MNKITLEDIKAPAEYEREREEIRRHIIDTKKRRRLAVGDLVSLVFENRDTVLFQVQEMVRAEKISDPSAIQEEIDTYSRSIPDPDELSATMFIEITEGDSIREDLDRLVGINEKVTLRIGEEHTVPAVFEPGWSREDRIAAVQYVKFPLTGEQKEAFVGRERRVAVEIDHPSYQAQTELPDEVRKALAEDLAATAAR